MTNTTESRRALRARRRAHHEAHAEEYLASSTQSLQSTTIAIELHELHEAVLHLAPARMIEIELNLAEVVGQTKIARLGASLAEAKEVRAWLDQFINAMEPAQ